VVGTFISLVSIAQSALSAHLRLEPAPTRQHSAIFGNQLMRIAAHPVMRENIAFIMLLGIGVGIGIEIGLSSVRPR
jgi:hypothetical protein